MKVDYWTLQGIASFLLIVAFTRTLTMRVPWELWHMTTYTLVGLIGATGIMLFNGQNPHVEVFFAGGAFVVGLAWTGLAQPHRGLSVAGHVISVVVAAVLTLVLALLALSYQWWTGPAIVLGLIFVAFVRDFFVLPAINHVRKQKGLPALQWVPEDFAQEEPAPRTEPVPALDPVPLHVPAPPSTAAVVEATRIGDWLTFACPQCARPGRVPPTLDGKRLRCTNCGTFLRPRRTATLALRYGPLPHVERSPVSEVATPRDTAVHFSSPERKAPAPKRPAGRKEAAAARRRER